MIWQAWWVWGVAAAALAILEVAVPGYVFLGFAGGAAVVALVLLAGGPLAVWLSGNLALLLLAFAVVSVLVWLAVRRLAGVRKGQVKVWDRDINDN